MNNYGIGTMSWIELLWTLSTTIGAILCGWLMHDALGDWRVAKRAGNGGRRMLAWEGLVSEIVATTQLMLFAGIGLWASLTPPPDHTERPTWLAIALGMTFVFVAIMLTINAALRRRWRRDYLRYWQSMARAIDQNGDDW